MSLVSITACSSDKVRGHLLGLHRPGEHHWCLYVREQLLTEQHLLVTTKAQSMLLLQLPRSIEMQDPVIRTSVPSMVLGWPDDRVPCLAKLLAFYEH